jgi:hypothetical protein
MIALMMLCIGAALGLRFRIFVLLPAILLGLFVYTARTACDNDLVDHATNVVADAPAIRHWPEPAQISDLPTFDEPCSQSA